MRLILYSKPGCHLCEGLQEKLEQIHTLEFDLEIRDITTNPEWFQRYEMEIPVLVLNPSASPDSLIPLPRLSPRASVQQVEQMLKKHWP